MRIKGEEYFITEQPGFMWIGKISLLPLVWITGIDKYIEGEGTFQIKLLSMLTIADAAKGKGELNRSELYEMACRSTVVSDCIITKQLFTLGVSGFKFCKGHDSL